MRRAKCFGINLARLDIRQESSRHSQLISEFLKRKYKVNYVNWNEDKKIKFLSSKIKSKKSLLIIFHLKIKKTKKSGQLSKFYLLNQKNVWVLMLFL